MICVICKPVAFIYSVWTYGLLMPGLWSMAVLGFKRGEVSIVIIFNAPKPLTITPSHLTNAIDLNKFLRRNGIL